MTGRTSRDGVAAPWWRSNSAGYGDGQMTGHADDATDTRIRWPGRNRYPVGRIATRTSSTRPGSSASGSLVRAAMGQVEDPGGDLGGRPVRGDVGQPDHRGRDRRRDREMEDDLRDAEDLERRLERLGGVGRAERLVRVGGRGPGRWAVRRRPTTGRRACRPSAGGDSGRRRPSPTCLAGPPGRASAADERQRPAAEPPLPRLDRRDAGMPSPPASAPATPPGTAPARRTRARTRRSPARCRRRSGSPSASGRRSARAHAGRRGSVPASPTIGRSWTQFPTIVRDGARAGGLHPERRIDVRVHPAADVEDRRLDRVVVGRQRTGTPVRPVVLLAEPFDQPRRRRLEPGEPFRAPGVAAERRIGWHRVHRDLADRVLAELAHRHAAADVVDVAQVAVVGAHGPGRSPGGAAAAASRPGSR